MRGEIWSLATLALCGALVILLHANSEAPAESLRYGAVGRHLLQPGQPNTVDRDSRLAGADPLFKVAQRIMRALPIPRITVQMLNETVSGTKSFNDYNSFAINFAIYFAIFTLAGLLLGIFWTIFPCCFYCCRFCGCNCCCHKCGGRDPRPEMYSRCESWTPIVGFLVCAGIIIGFGVTGLVYNTMVDTAVKDFVADIGGTIDDAYNRVSTILSTVDPLLNNVQTTFGSVNNVLDGTPYQQGTNMSLGASIVANNTAKMEDVVTNLFELEAMRQDLLRELNATQDSMDTVRDDTALLKANLADLDAEIQGILTTNVPDVDASCCPRTVNTPDIYQVHLPLPIGSGLPILSDAADLTNAQHDINNLDNFTEVGLKTRAQWANVTHNIDSQVDDANKQLSDITSNVITSTRDTLHDFSDLATDMRDKVQGYKGDYLDSSVKWYDDHVERYRILVYAIPVYVVIGIAAVVFIAICISKGAKKPVPWLFTICAVLLCYLMFIMWLVYTVYFPLAYIGDEVCDLSEQYIEAYLALPENANYSAAFNECTKASNDGNVLNTPLISLSDLMDKAGISDAKNNVKKQVADSLNLGDAFNYGGNDLKGDLDNSTTVDYNGFNFTAFNFSVKAGILFDLQDISAKAALASSKITPTLLLWDPANVTTAECNLNALTVPHNGKIWRRGNYTQLDFTQYTSVSGIHAAWDALNQTVYADDYVTTKVTDLKATLDDIAAKAAYYDQYANMIQSNITLLNAQIAQVQNLSAAFQAQAVITHDKANTLEDGMGSEVNATVAHISAIVGQKVDSTFDSFTTFANTLGECGFLGRDYKAFRTDICESLIGSMTIMWLTASIIALVMMPAFGYGVCNSKRAYGQKKDDPGFSSAGFYSETEIKYSYDVSDGELSYHSGSGSGSFSDTSRKSRR